MNTQTETALRIIAQNNFNLVADAERYVNTETVPPANDGTTSESYAEGMARTEKIMQGRVSMRLAFKFAQSPMSASMPEKELDKVDFSAIVEEYRARRLAEMDAHEAAILAQL